MRPTLLALILVLLTTDAQAQKPSLYQRARSWVQVNLALRGAGVNRVLRSSRFTKGSLGGGSYTPGARSEAGQMRQEVNELRGMSTRVIRDKNVLSFYNGDRLLGRLATLRTSGLDQGARVVTRRAKLVLAGGAIRTFTLEQTRNVSGNRPGTIRTSKQVVSSVKLPGRPERRTTELHLDGTTTGWHEVRDGRTRYGDPSYAAVESWTKVPGHRRQIRPEQGFQRFGLTSMDAPNRELTLPIGN